MNDIERAVRDNLQENCECTCDACVDRSTINAYAAEPVFRAKHRRELLDELIAEAESTDTFPFGDHNPTNDELAEWIRHYGSDVQ